MRKNIIFILAACILLSGCGLYKKYEQNVETPTDIYGATGYITAPVDSTSLAQLSWREFFTDPLLQNLIDRVLANNTDLNSARLAVEISEESLKTAKAAYLPAISFAPSGTLSSFDFGAVGKTYSVPLQLNMDVELFGGITNKKRAANAALLQSQMREEAVRANLISTVAQQYFLLQVLDRELAILNETDSLWNASLEMEKSLWENGKAFSTAVNQMEASYLNVKTQVVDIRRAIVSVENSICRLLAEPPHHIERGAWGSSALPEHPETTTGQRMFDKKFIKIGVPAKMLELRPDVRLANYAMEEAFYNTQAARAAFFPSLSLQGLVGWTNNAGSVIVNPGKILLNAVASLTQPIYARGKIKANYNIAKYTEEDIRQKYIQTVIDAGNQVNEALADCQAARDKYKYYRRQVEVLHEAYIGTHELMDNGKSDYIEVLTAQESLLSAQLNEVLNMYDGAQAVIELYIALGGATK
ncbi:MAG: TolC family protein [Muribaculaceae bacterium]|nr:TolC family protein [Muribaculaceae bacterium]